RDFAASLASLRDEGFIALERAGTIAALSDRAATMLGPETATGTALATLLDDRNALLLRSFLEQPARFAETERPALALRTLNGAVISLFAEGMAGVVKGYFGLVAEPAEPSSDPSAPAEDP